MDEGVDDRVSCLLVWIQRVELHDRDILEGGYWWVLECMVLMGKYRY